jgi:putative transposase
LRAGRSKQKITGYAGGSQKLIEVDQVHLRVSIPAKKSARMIFDRHANLKYKFGNRHFWWRGYYVSTVGLNEAAITKYVRESEKHDQMMDRISTKEAEDPFRGSQVIDAQA